MAKVSEKKVSLLAAAIKVLGGSKKPMTCGQIVELIITRKLWKPSEGGATPAATLSTKFLYERRRGSESRVAQVGRGLFTTVENAKRSKMAITPAPAATTAPAKSKAAKKVPKGKAAK